MVLLMTKKENVMKKVLGLCLSLFVMVAATQVMAEEYTIDGPHSSFGFSVAHLMITKTNGAFNEFEGTINYEAGDPASFAADVTIQTASIDTNNEKRDDHLRNPDFFNAPEYPTITFNATALTPESGNNYTITGDLTMKEVTKSIDIPVTIQGPVQSPFGGSVIGIEGETVIDRQDWNITWNKDLDNGGVVVGNDVTLKINIEAVAK